MTWSGLLGTGSMDVFFCSYILWKRWRGSSPLRFARLESFEASSQVLEEVSLPDCLVPGENYRRSWQGIRASDGPARRNRGLVVHLVHVLFPLLGPLEVGGVRCD